MAEALASRDDLVRQADKHQRQGRTDLAIEVYERLVQQTPTDWSSVKQLADLCERAGQREAAAARFLQCADHYFEEGFHPRASALYRKVLKLDPHSEHALCQLAEIALQLELKVDARQALSQVLDLRRRRGDAAGAEAISARLAALDGSPRVAQADAPGADDAGPEEGVPEDAAPEEAASEDAVSGDAVAEEAVPEEAGSDEATPASAHLPPAPAPRPPAGADTLAARLRGLADEAVARGDLDGAKRAWTAVLHVDPGDRSLRLQLLATALAEGDAGAAVSLSHGLDDASAETLAWRFRAARLAGGGDDERLVAANLRDGDTTLALDVREVLQTVDAEAADAWMVLAVHTLSAHAEPAVLAAFADDLARSADREPHTADREPHTADGEPLTADEGVGGDVGDGWDEVAVEPQALDATVVEDPVAGDSVDDHFILGDVLIDEATPVLPAADATLAAPDGEDGGPTGDAGPIGGAEPSDAVPAADDLQALDAWLLGATTPPEDATPPAPEPDAECAPTHSAGFDWGALLGREVAQVVDDPADESQPIEAVSADEPEPGWLLDSSHLDEAVPPAAAEAPAVSEPDVDDGRGATDTAVTEPAEPELAEPELAEPGPAALPLDTLLETSIDAPVNAPVDTPVTGSAIPDEPIPAPAVSVVEPDGTEIDLTDLLDALLPGAQPVVESAPAGRDVPPGPGPGSGPGGDERPAGDGGRAQATQQVAAGRVFAAAGLVAEAARSFERASKDVRTRFEAAAALGDLHRSRGQLAEAVRWYDMAAEAPAPDATARRPVLYDLAETLETVGAADRALAVLLDLLSEVEDYRDARARADRLLRVEAGG